MRKERKPPLQQPDPTDKNKHGKHIRLLMEILGGIVVLITLFQWLSVPASVVPGEILAGNALESPFTVSNTSSLMAIHSVDIQCDINSANLQNGFGMGRIEFEGFSNRSPIIEPGESTSLFCRAIKGSQMVTADVTITAKYRPSFTWFRKEVKRRFVARKDVTGQLKWIPYGISDPTPEPGD